MNEMHATTISMYQTYLCDRILEVSKSDLRYEDVKATLQQGMSQWKFQGYELIEDGILMYRCRVYTPNDQDLEGLMMS
jgi:hypothetical protein